MRNRIGRYGRLLTETGSEEAVHVMAAPRAATSGITGFHVFPFGGLRKAGNWLRSFPQTIEEQGRSGSRAD